MTSTAAPWLNRLLTLDEWDAIDKKDLDGRAELVEGVLVVAPCPISRHQRIAGRLFAVLDRQLGDVTLDVEVLADPDPQATVRRPDVVVLRPGADHERYRFDPAEVLAVFEVLSPGTTRVDRVFKLHEYAEAGILHYGIVDPGQPPDTPVTLTEFALDGGLYRRVAEHTGTADLALGARIDLGTLA